MPEKELASGFYDEPVLYDVLHSAGTADEILGLVRINERLGLGKTGPWLEPACGSGRYVRAAIARGIRIAAFDASEAMIRYARERLGGVRASHYRLGVASMEDFDASTLAPGWRFTLAFNPINTIRHLETDLAMQQHLKRVHDALRPGGVYVIGLSLSMYGLEQPSEDTWEGVRGSLRVKQVIQFVPPAGPGERFEEVFNVLHVHRPIETTTIPSSYKLRTYDCAQWQAIIDASPFALIGCADESGVNIDPPRLGYALWLLRRPR